ncbi:MAG: RimK/LysX family protein [Planctomycetota bacterium]
MITLHTPTVDFRRQAVVTLCLGVLAAGGCGRPSDPANEPSTKRTIGATALILEQSTGVEIAARVDTGAHTCSIDAEQIEIEDASTDASANIGKQIRFLMRSNKDESTWITSTITGQADIRTADGKKTTRYEVRLTLQWEGFEKEVLVTLNDRSQLKYPMLLGRNYLYGDFVVDVSLNSDDEVPVVR